MKSNPLLVKNHLPNFNKICAKHFFPAITTIINNNHIKTAKLLSQKKLTWDNFVEPFEKMLEDLTSVWYIVDQLNSVVGGNAIKKAHNRCLLAVTKYFIEVSQSSRLYKAISSVKDKAHLNDLQKEIITKKLRNFQLHGANLPWQKKRVFTKLTKQLVTLENKFCDNVLAATQKWIICLNKKQIKGLPEYALAIGKDTASRLNKLGWCYCLDFPSYHALVTFADSVLVRKKVTQGYVTRASELGLGITKKYDNTKIIRKILTIRAQLARLLGFNNYAQYSLATKMVKDPEQVLDFLSCLACKSIKLAKKEYLELKNYAKKCKCKKFSAWDIAYYKEKLYQKKFQLSSQMLRPYFPLPQVLQGMFEITKRLYGITVVEKKKVSVWHPDVKFFEIYDSNKNLRGQFYIDLYCRQNKRDGAWVCDCRTYPAISTVYLVCNFCPPQNNAPALLTHQEVTTLFHEFGHCLHHLLSKVPYTYAAGIRNVPLDAVEFPSQFMENWCFCKEGLGLIAKHYKTKEPPPDKFIKKLFASKNYYAATNMLRQLRFALIDFRIHLEFDHKKHQQLEKIIKQIDSQFNFMPKCKLSRILHSFTHVFSSGYAAGYYSYKWAEVLSSDAFSKFEKNGIFDKKTGRDFLKNILETGSSQDPMVLFEKFRGRAPKMEALLRHSGIL